MKHKILGLLAVGLLCATTANAIPLRLDAASVDPEWSDFFVIFDDTGDGLLQQEEAIQFSGATSSDGIVWNLLIGVPTIDGISGLSGFCPLADRWCFVSPEIGLLVAVSTDTFTYAISPAPISEPVSMALLGLGLLGLGLTRRRKAN